MVSSFMQLWHSVTHVVEGVGGTAQSNGLDMENFIYYFNWAVSFNTSAFLSDMIIFGIKSDSVVWNMIVFSIESVLDEYWWIWISSA